VWAQAALLRAGPGTGAAVIRSKGGEEVRKAGSGVVALHVGSLPSKQAWQQACCWPFPATYGGIESWIGPNTTLHQTNPTPIPAPRLPEAPGAARLDGVQVHQALPLASRLTEASDLQVPAARSAEAPGGRAP